MAAYPHHMHMPPLPAFYNQRQHPQVLTTFPQFPPNGTLPAEGHAVVELSDDDSDNGPPLAVRPAFHRTQHYYDLDREPIDLVSDSGEELLPGNERPRPSRIPQVVKRIRLDPGSRALHDIPRRQTIPSQGLDQTRINVSISPTDNHGEAIVKHHLGDRTSNAVPHTGSPINVDLAVLPKKHSHKKSTSGGLAPYYYDTDLEVDMYRGPGYEKYPIVLGTIREHQIIADRYNAAQRKRQLRKTAKLLRHGPQTEIRIYGSDSSSDSDLDSDDEEYEGTHFDQLCLAAVVEVFPNVQRRFVLDRVLKHPWRLSKVREVEVLAPSDSIIPEDIITELIELDSYPKEPKATKEKELPDDGTGKTVTWNRNLPKDAMYLKDAVVLLAKVFDHVPTCYIHRIVHEKKSIIDAYVHLDDMETRFHRLPARPYARLRMPRVTLEKKYQHTGRDQRLPQQYASRVNELQAAKQHVERELIRDRVQEAKEEAEKRNLEDQKALGAIASCGCCFEEEVPLNRIVSCMGEPAHLFCFDCTSRLAETQVGFMKHEMKCMDVASCSAELSWTTMAKAIDIKTFDRLQLNRQQAEVMAAKLDGLEQCPFCDYKAVCDPVDVDPVFPCQNPECGVVSCRKCQQETHLPKTCEEYKKDNDLTARHRVEEARSGAVMRTCPKCKVKIIKEDGCNKMVCSTCKCIMCYECQEDLTKLGQNAYNHFNKPGAKCSLYDKVGVDRHAEEADDAEREAIRKAKEEDATVDEARLRVETGKPKSKVIDTHPARDLLLQHANMHRDRVDQDRLLQNRVLQQQRARREAREEQNRRHQDFVLQQQRAQREAHEQRIPNRPLDALDALFRDAREPFFPRDELDRVHRRMAAVDGRAEFPQPQGVHGAGIRPDQGRNIEAEVRQRVKDAWAPRAQNRPAQPPPDPPARQLDQAGLGHWNMPHDPFIVLPDMVQGAAQQLNLGPLDYGFPGYPRGVNLGPLPPPPYNPNPPLNLGAVGAGPNQPQFEYPHWPPLELDPLEFEVDDDFGFNEIFGRPRPY